MGPDDLESAKVVFYRRRTVDPEVHRRRDMDELKDALRKAYPVAAVVQDVDSKFMQLLERMADLDLERRRSG